MYFILSKILWLIVLPSNLIILALALGGWLMLMRWRRSGAVVFLLGFVALVLGGISSLPDRALATLEERFPRCDVDQLHPDGIVVLGGGVHVLPSAAWNRLIVNDSGSRIIMMADFARRFPNAKLVFTGGYGSLLGEPVSEADVISNHSGELGLARDRIIFETQSRNTIENAIFTKNLVSPKPNESWVLVTSAFHMPRAYGMFEKAGFPVTACASDYLSLRDRDEDDLKFSLAWRFKILNLVTREWIGLAAAWVYGYTDEIFPGPKTSTP